MDEPLAYEVTEAARQLGVGRSTMFGLIKTGEVRSFTLGRRRLIPRQSLQEIIDRKLGEQPAAAS